MKYIILFCCFEFLSQSHASSKNLDSLLAAKINMTKPYLIVNITSHDCITCRAGAANILNKLASNYKNKIVLLADDKNMALYYNDNSDIYSGYPRIFNKYISDSLAFGPFSSACLIEKEGVHCFSFKNMNDDTLAYFKSQLDHSDRDLSSHYVIKDTVFADYSRLFFDNRNAFLFNNQFQIGLMYEMNLNHSEYLRPKFNDSTINKLYKILTFNGIKKLTNATIGRSTVNKMGLSEISLISMDLKSNSIYFKIYVVAKDSVFKGTDTNINTYVIPMMFFAKGTSGQFNILDLGNYNSFSQMDTIHYLGNTLSPHLGNYEAKDTYIYMPYKDQDHCMSEKVDGKELTLPTNLSIVKFSFAKNDQPKVEFVYQLDESDENGPNIYYTGTFFYRISDQGFPIAVNQTKKHITLVECNTKIPFNNFIFDIDDTINSVSDIARNNDTLKMVATTRKNNTVKIIYCISAKKYIINKINIKQPYHSLRIQGNTILGYRKNDDANEINYDRFTF